MTTPTPLATHRRTDAGVRFSSLVRIEARKLVDTRAAFWLLVATAVLALVVMAAGVFVPLPERGPLTFGSIAGDGVQSLQLLAPILAILIATAEWTHRGALVTFALEPRRWRVLVAKLVAAVGAALVLSLVMVVAAVPVALVALNQGRLASGSVGVELAWAVFGTILIVLQGLGLGLLILNTAGAIAAYFLAPAMLQMAGMLVPALTEPLTWINLGSALGPLMPGGVGEVSWPKIVTSLTFWVIAPTAIGAWRTLRREAS